MRSKTIIPKIAVPIISRSKEEILADAECISSSCADAAEWRVDFYEDMNDHEKTVSLAHEIRRILNGKQFLFTCRTSAEGGEAEITSADYRELLFEAVAGRCADMIDAEIDTAKVFMKDLVSKAKSQGIAIVISHHNFKETPDRSRILNKFKEMNESGGDILKVAVMPNCRADV
ncbi:MAG: type I 3-dehydroquinate dehydratase, partial [Christensenellaceae bacterium]|nr:type I 3-dehydroquinate dehydratase [Christensenellaceae bacterium]